MRLLLLDSKNYYGKYLIERIEKNCSLDVITEQNNNVRYENCKIILGSRRSLEVWKKTADYYDVIIDADSMVVEDVETVLNEIKCDKYILISTVQVYRYLPHKVHQEEDIDEYYINIINDEYVDCSTDIDKFYVREKINIECKTEALCKKKGINYFILRMAKCYRNSDIYKDIDWIIGCLIDYNCIFLHEANVMDMGCFNPIYEKDMCDILEKVVYDDVNRNMIINVAQDETVSMISLSQYVAQILYGVMKFKVVFIPENDLCHSREIKVPCNTELIVDNHKLKEVYNVSFLKTEIWIKLICESILKRGKCKKISSQERKAKSLYLNYCEKAKKFFASDNSVRNNQQEKVININEIYK